MIAEVVTGSGPLRPSRTLLVVLDRMVETVFLSLMGTTMGVLLAVPLSFLGAKNLVGHLPAGTLVVRTVRPVEELAADVLAYLRAEEAGGGAGGTRAGG